VKTGIGMTALHLAVYKGNTSMVKLLLRTGANIFVENWEGMTPQSYAVSLGHHSIAKLIPAVMLTGAVFLGRYLYYVIIDIQVAINGINNSAFIHHIDRTEPHKVRRHIDRVGPFVYLKHPAYRYFYALGDTKCRFV